MVNNMTLTERFSGLILDRNTGRVVGTKLASVTGHPKGVSSFPLVAVSGLVQVVLASLFFSHLFQLQVISWCVPMPNTAVKAAPFGRWARRFIAQRPLP